LLSLARSVREQRQKQRGKKIYSLHAHEVECIGKGKAHRPYVFGAKVSLATTLNHSAGRQFVAHVKALPGNPYDGHTLEKIIPDIERQIGASIKRLVADKGYRGHNAPWGPACRRGVRREPSPAHAPRTFRCQPCDGHWRQRERRTSEGCRKSRRKP
jgi:hypothetical protein